MTVPQHPVRNPPSLRRPHRPLSPGGFLAIALVFALGATLAMPVPATAQAGTANLRGTVTDADGLPLADVLVEIRQSVAGDLYHYRSATTDDQGAYSFSSIDAGGWTLVARHEKYRTNETSATLSPGETETFDIELVPLSTYAYTGTVWNGEDNTPLPGATITITGYGSEGPLGERQARSASDGAFRVLLFSGENQITVRRSGFGPYQDWIYNPGSDVQRDIYLYPMPDQSSVVKVRVVDGSGDPVQAWVDLYTDWSRQYQEERFASGAPGYAEGDDVAYSEPVCYGCGGGTYNSNSSATDEQGRLTMKAFPGPVVITANRVGYLTESAYLTLEKDKTTEVTLTLKALPERTVTVKGRVTDAETGDPIPGASVSVQVPDAADSQWVTTDDDGRFTVTVRPGYTMVEVYAEYWGPIILEAETEAAESEDGEAKPIAPAPAPPPSEGPSKRYLPRVTTFRTEDGETRTVDLGLKPKPPAESLFIGYVVDTETGEAVPGAQVSVQNHETGDWGDATTDENGSFKFHLYGGYHTVRVWMEGYLPFAVNLEIPDDGTTREDLEISPGSYVSEGWWDPDGDHYYGGGGIAYDVAEEGSYAPEAPPTAPTSGSAGSPRSVASDEDSAESRSSSGNIRGEAGGLPAYDPDKSDSTFGLTPDGESKDSPLGGLVAVLAIGLVALVVGLRRRE